MRYYLIRANASLRIAVFERCGSEISIEIGEYALVSEQVKTALSKRHLITVIGSVDMPPGCPIIK